MLIESSCNRVPPNLLPPWKPDRDTEPPPPSTTSEYQDGQARKEREDGLISRDLPPQLHRKQQLQPELLSDEHQGKHAPEPADGIPLLQYATWDKLQKKLHLQLVSTTRAAHPHPHRPAKPSERRGERAGDLAASLKERRGTDEEREKRRGDATRT